MRALTKIVFGSLLGIALVLTGSTQAKADNCLLVICVDAPVVGPVVGTIGDVVEGILTPSNPAPPVPPVQPPVQPPVNPPVQPPTNPTTPQQPTSPGTGGTGTTTPAESGNSDEVIGTTDGTQTPVPTMSPLPSPTPTPTPTEVKTPIQIIPDDPTTFGYVSALTPYIVGILAALLIALLCISVVRFIRYRKHPWHQDTSALPWDLKPRK